MPSYIVRWEIEIDADTPWEAAEEALGVQRDPESLATAFLVKEDGCEDYTEIDLSDGTGF